MTLKSHKIPFFKFTFLMPSIMQDIKSLHPLLFFFIFEPPYLALINENQDVGWVGVGSCTAFMKAVEKFTDWFK